MQTSRAGWHGVNAETSFTRCFIHRGVLILHFALMVLLVPMRLRHAEPPDGVSFEVELDQYRRLTTDDVTIVAGRHRDDLRGFEHLDTSIGIHHVDAPLDEKTDVCVHAVVAADVRFRVD